MKIAVCFAGGTRNYHDTFPLFKHFFQDVYKPDIFIYGVENKDGFEQNIKELLEIYKPKNIIINSVNFYNNNIFNIPQIKFNTPTVVPMLYNIMQCNQLKKKYEQENNFVYDIVVRARLDNFFIRTINQTELNIEDNTVLIPQEWSNIKGVHPLAEGDGFAIGKSNAIDLYSKAFLNIQEINCGHPETLLGLHLKKCNLQIRDIPIPISFAYPDNIDIGNVHGHNRAMWRVKWDKTPHYSNFNC